MSVASNTFVRVVSVMSENGSSVQCDELVDDSSTAQLMVFVRMIFNDLALRDEFLTLLSLKNTTKAVDIYDALK